jgi:transketolase
VLGDGEVAEGSIW